MTKYLITGVAGFIGSNLAEHLIAEGEEVVGIDNFLTGKKENIAPFQHHMNFVEGDIRDTTLLRDLCTDVDYILHHGAMASVPWSMKEPMLCHEHNTTGTLNVLLAARDAGVQKVVMAVTSAAYGNTEVLPAHEKLPTEALSPYGATKLMGEIYLQLFSTAYGLPTVGLRYFNVFGQRQDPKSAYAAAIPIFAKKLLAGTAPTVFGDGEQTRDFVYIKDIVQANLKACHAPAKASGQVFNIGTGTQITVNTLIDDMKELLDIHIDTIYADERAGDVKHSVASIEKAKQMLNYTPKYTVYEGLKEAIEWYRENL